MRRRTADFLQGISPAPCALLLGEDRANRHVSSQPGKTRKRRTGKENGQWSNFQSPGLRSDWSMDLDLVFFLLAFFFCFCSRHPGEWRKGGTERRCVGSYSAVRFSMFLISHERKCEAHDDSQGCEAAKRARRKKARKIQTKNNEINYHLFTL